jgi:hypothetical protein
MPRRGNAVHVTTTSRHYTGKDGQEKVYQTVLLRRSYRQDGKVRNETLANLSHLPAPAIDAIRSVLDGKELIEAGAGVAVLRSMAHGDIAAVHTAARQLGFPAILGPACPERDLAYALILSRVARPASKLATLAWWDDVTLGADLAAAGASTDDAYAAMDWLRERQDDIEAGLARRHLAEGGMALFDLSSSWIEGSHCALAARGYSRDGKRGRPQIEYGLLTDPQGRPVAIRVFAGNTADPAAFTEAVRTVREDFGLDKLVMAGDRGMITSARIAALKDDTALGWVTALRGPAIRKLAAAGGGPLQMSLFDEQDLAEITSPDYPGERLIACRNPFLAADRARKRHALLAATEAELAKAAAGVTAGRLKDPDKIGLRAGRVINKYKVAKHFTLAIGEGTLTWTRDQDKIDAEAALDGIYIIRTSVPASQLDAPGAVAAYKNLAQVERDFRIIKSDDLDLRPVFHRLDERVRAHILICMLACYLTWHLRKAWAPLTYTDEQPPARHNPVAPARRSAAAARKASRRADDNGQPLRSYQGLLAHLATLTRNTIRAGTATFDQLSVPTETQRQAFELLAAPIPLTLQ